MAATDFSTTEAPNAAVMPLNNSGAHLGHTVSVLCNVYALPVLCFIGILGNVANLITLNSVKLRSVSYIYLRALSAADLSCMIFVLIFAYFELVKLLQFEHLFGNYKAVWYRAHVMLPAINISVNAGILVVVLLTIERYICIAWPVYFRDWNVRVKAITLISLAYMTALTLYLPMCWQMKAAKLELWWPPNNTDYFVPDLYKVVDNPAVFHNHYYKAYKWTRETLLKFIPIIVLAALNLLIALAFRKFKQRRSRLIIKNNTLSKTCTSSLQRSLAESVTNPVVSPAIVGTAAGCKGQLRRVQQHSQQQYLREQRNLYILLTVVAVMFFVCNTPAAINLLLISDELKKSPGYLIFRALANFMEITNHALNFYVFCMCSEDYRRTFVATFPCVIAVHKRTTDMRRHFLTRYITKNKDCAITLVSEYGVNLISTVRSPSAMSNPSHQQNQIANQPNSTFKERTAIILDKTNTLAAVRNATENGAAGTIVLNQSDETVDEKYSGSDTSDCIIITNDPGNYCSTSKELIHQSTFLTGSRSGPLLFEETDSSDIL